MPSKAKPREATKSNLQCFKVVKSLWVEGGITHWRSIEFGGWIQHVMVANLENLYMLMYLWYGGAKLHSTIISTLWFRYHWWIHAGGAWVMSIYPWKANTTAIGWLQRRRYICLNLFILHVWPCINIIIRNQLRQPMHVLYSNIYKVFIHAMILHNSTMSWFDCSPKIDFVQFLRLSCFESAFQLPKDPIYCG